jgi:hypothetical protein
LENAATLLFRILSSFLLPTNKILKYWIHRTGVPLSLLEDEQSPKISSFNCNFMGVKLGHTTTAT